MSITGVAVATAMMLLVTGLALGLVDHYRIGGEAGYVVSAGGDGFTTSALPVEGPSLGAVHKAADRLKGVEGVTGVTPVHINFLKIGVPNSGEEEYFLVLGIIPSKGVEEVSGFSTSAMTGGDPFYAEGTYNGTWTGEAVLSESASSLLEAGPGTRIEVRGASEKLKVVDVDASSGPGFAGLPVVLIHLSELQDITGGKSSDRAEKMLVNAEKDVGPFLKNLYPGADVSRPGAGSGIQEDLPMAMALTSSLVALVIGTLFLATTLSLEVSGDVQNLALLSAIGFSRLRIYGLVIGQVVTITLTGGLIGLGLGIAGATATNNFVAARYSIPVLIQIPPYLAAAGVALAVLMGLVSTPYLLLITRGLSVSEVLSK